MRRWVVSVLILVFACVFCSVSMAGGAAPERKVPRWYDPEDPFCTRPWLDYPVGEVPVLRGPCARHTQNPDYTITAEVFQRPFHYRGADRGVYVNRSNRMRVEVFEDGGAIATANGHFVEIGIGGGEFERVRVRRNAATYESSSGRQQAELFIDGDRVVAEARNDGEAEMVLLFRNSGDAGFATSVPHVGSEGNRMRAYCPVLLAAAPGQ